MVKLSKQQKAIQELLRRRQQDPTRILKGAFPQQLAFIDDPAKLKALWCTRRAAKSYTAGLYMVYEALANPGCNILFLGLTRLSAKKIIWKDILAKINKDFGLQGDFNKSELTVTFPNGSVIWITGCDADEESMNKLLGGKYRLVCIDEGSLYTINVRHLVYDILKPAVADPNAKGERGIICMMGTSSDFTQGLFYDVATGKEAGWSLHQWSAHDNPYVAKQWQEELDEIATKRPLYALTPQYRQWFLNEWVVDEEKLVYRFNEHLNSYSTIPLSLSPEGWVYTLGVDLGWEDDNAFVLTAYHANDPNLYVVRTFNKPKMTFDQVVERIQVFMADPHCAPTRVIIDGANKQGIETMRVRSQLPFEFADKTGKADFIQMLNADFIQGKIKINERLVSLKKELKELLWMTDGDKIAFPRKEHPACKNHLVDALLYAWRMSYHFHSAPKEAKAVVGTPAWHAEQNTNIWEREREKLMEEECGNFPHF